GHLGVLERAHGVDAGRSDCDPRDERAVVDRARGLERLHPRSERGPPAALHAHARRDAGHDPRVKRFAAAVVLVAVAPTVALALRSVGMPDPNTQAQADGCRRSNIGIFQHVAPNWVYVDDAGSPANGPPPPPLWAGGVASAKHRPYAGAYPTGVDDSLTHTSYDFVMNIRVDPQYADLLGTGNFADSSDEQRRLHVEWE